MKWYTLFRQHILDRGIAYYEDGNVIEFDYADHEIIAQVDGTDIYDVQIELDHEEVLDMHCSCPYARDGYNCKHMAAVLFAFEGMLADEDAEDILPEETTPISSYETKHQREKAEAVELVSKIPEEKIRELLVGFVLADESLKHNLQMEYSFEMNARLMQELRAELDRIVYRNSRNGYVDWYHASEFTEGLVGFLDAKVLMLVEKNCLRQAFELTNLVFHCIGNIDMDDSNGGTSFVADRCYDCWKQIVEKCDNGYRGEIKKWFEEHRTGYVIDFLEEYIEEILLDAFASEEVLEEEIQELDAFINRSRGNDCGQTYSVRYGYENAVLKRIEYMKKMNCSEEEIREYRQANRRFFVIRELEISETVEKNDYETAIKLLLESKCLDEDNQKQQQKYSKQLIELYQKIGASEEYCKELIYYLENFWQSDLTYMKMLKSSILDSEQWNHIVDDIVKKNQYEDFVCKLLCEEQRYEELMGKIENNTHTVGLLDTYEKVLRKKMPERVIKFYSSYLENAVVMANDRGKYKSLMIYLKKISKCAGGKAVAGDIADAWKREYKRKSAMMDELKKAGF